MSDEKTTMSDEKTKHTPDFTREQRWGLRQVITKRPHEWKALIRSVWTRAACSAPWEYALYSLRASHGPTWLRKVTAKKILAAIGKTEDLP